MKQPPRKRLPHEQSHQSTGRPPPGQQDSIDAVVVTLLGLPLYLVVGLLVSTAPVLAVVVAAIAGIATLSVVIPYVTIRIVTIVLERRSPNSQSIRNNTELNESSNPE
ncbi:MULTISPECIES: hypothetical protein [unclassified Haladaptatus]|uniref:hypothetical protein n=1 Tax=unclassified Haladaptatus TaxID=2622732 RepID=UPI00209C3037|nr:MULTISPECIES: hypothetical protein [unclassified Haladaptatus]MCO8243454.1 hypothetical protein [Haladaptatus sp. AB643]MCO8254863.1 hypothetical protein [Haladaptatus sp. AB618]